MPYIKFRCLQCGLIQERHHNARKCIRSNTGECEGRLIHNNDRGTCPTCGRPLNPRPRICGRCKKPITNHHKWYVSGSTIYHRNCDDPNSYGTRRS